jgi:hypothetical protein
MVAAQPWGAANKPNMNVSWMRDRSAWVIYILALAGFRYFVSVISFESISPAASWSIVHLTHFLVCEYLPFNFKSGPCKFADGAQADGIFGLVFFFFSATDHLARAALPQGFGLLH